MSKPTILTGLRANNDLHIGNYFGALLPLIDMAKKHAGEYQINLFMPDLHSFTTPIDHSELQANIMNALRTFVAAGLPLDHPDVYIYRQSYIPAHSELTVILNSFATFGEMERMTQFKEKSRIDVESEEFTKKFYHVMEIYRPDLMKSLRNDDESVYATKTFPELLRVGVLFKEVLDEVTGRRASVGLFDYPVLMAADILLYGAQYVPVGDDQTQHLEITRDLGQRMNNKFGDIFQIPDEVKKQHAFFGKEQGLRIKDLVDPAKKMSKSDESGKGIIFLNDDPKAAAKKIMSATTDSVGSIHYDLKKQPGISNLLQILALLADRDLQAVIEEYEGQTRYGDLKQAVAEAVEEFLTHFQRNFHEVDMLVLKKKLEDSEAKMNHVANKTLLKVQTAVGLR